jgi:hypothetical protein
MKKEIEQWIDNFVSVHNEEYGQIPCPYARAAKVKYIETDDLGKSLADVVNNWSDEYQVACLYTATKNYTPYDLNHLIMEFNHVSMPRDLVALEDHPKEEEIINGVKMNFGKCILVLVQRLSDLNQSSDILREKGYYNNWSQENLDDVVAWRFGMGDIF